MPRRRAMMCNYPTLFLVGSVPESGRSPAVAVVGTRVCVCRNCGVYSCLPGDGDVFWVNDRCRRRRSDDGADDKAGARCWWRWLNQLDAHRGDALETGSIKKSRNGHKLRPTTIRVFVSVCRVCHVCDSSGTPASRVNIFTYDRKDLRLCPEKELNEWMRELD